MTFTTQPMAKPFGWQGEHATRKPASQYRAAPSNLGNVEPGRVKEFEQGIKDGSHHGLRTAAVMAGTYAAIRGVQHWSAWRKSL